MKTPRKTILSASAISAFAMTLALGLSANVDQTSRQQGAPLQGVHPPTQYGTPGEREAGWQDPVVTESKAAEEAAELRESSERSAQKSRQSAQEFGQRQESRMQETRMHSSARQSTSQHASKASELMDKRVENSQGERLGSVEDIIIDVESGELEYVVVSAGGVLGMGDELRAVPPEALRTSGQDRVVLDITRDRWEQAPTFERKNIQQLGQGQSATEIRRFYSQDTASVSSDEQREFGARESISPSESSATSEWGSRSQSESRTQEDLSSSPRSSAAPSAPSQNWQRRHQTAEPHRLPGDPYGTPAEPRVMHRSQLDDQASLNLDREASASIERETQSEQREFGARLEEPEPYQYDSRATEWRARAFEEELRQAGAEEEAELDRQMEFGSRQMRSAQENEGPTLHNPRLHYTNRGSERGGSTVPLFSAVEQLESEQQVQYGAPQRAEETKSRMTKRESSAMSTSSMRDDRQTSMQTGSNLKLGSELLGSDVSDQQQQNIGEISDILVNLEEGQVEHMIVSTEAKPQKFAVPLRQLEIEEQGKRVMLQTSREQLEQAPLYRQSASARSNEIFRYEEQSTQTREFGARPADESRSDLVPTEPEAAEPQSSSAIESSSATATSSSQSSTSSTEAAPAADQSSQEPASATEFGAPERDLEIESDLEADMEETAEDVESATKSAAEETREDLKDAREKIDNETSSPSNP